MVALGWVLGWIWGPRWSQVGAKIDQKSKLKKACNKDDVRELLNVKILGQSGAWELSKVKKVKKIRPAAVRGCAVGSMRGPHPLSIGGIGGYWEVLGGLHM